MKWSRILWFIAVGIFVYWAAAYDTFANFLESIFTKLEPLGVIIDKYTNIAIDYLNSINHTQGNRLLNRILLGFSILALILSVVYRFALKNLAAERHYTKELNSLIQDAAICVVLTLFAHNNIHWWSILAIPMFSFVILYPLLFIPYYRFFRWVYAIPYDILAFGLGFFTFVIQMTQATLGGKILGVIFAAIATWYFITHRKFKYCLSCKKYTNLDILCIYDTAVEREWEGGKTRVATGYDYTYKIDSYGNKTLISKTATGYKEVIAKHKSTTYSWCYKYTCPYCGHIWHDKGSKTEQNY